MFAQISYCSENNTATEVHTITTIAEIHTVHICNLCDHATDSKNRLAKHIGDIHGKYPREEAHTYIKM